MREERRELAHLARKRVSRTIDRTGLRLMARVRPAAPPVRPVFIIGCPRSGTTLTSALLRRHPELAGTGAEGHLLWDAHQHPSDKGWGSDRSVADDIARGEPRFLNAAIHRISGEKRFVDKTPKNAVRIPYLNALFPDASFVFVTRDARPNVASLIEGWTLRHGISCRVPETLDIGVYQGRLWCYILPPGWREVTHAPVEEVAAFQYVRTNEIAQDDLAALEPSRVVTVRFEDLLASPQETATHLLDGLGLPPSDAIMRFAGTLDEHPVSVVTQPRPDKWRERQAQIAAVMPTLAPAMRRLGYSVEEVRG